MGRWEEGTETLFSFIMAILNGLLEIISCILRVIEKYCRLLLK